MSQKTKTPLRRRFLKSAAGGAVATGALAAPMVSTAQTISLRFQSTWPAKDIFHEYANDFAKKVNDMAGARVKIEVLPAGAVVGAFQLLEGVAKGKENVFGISPSYEEITWTGLSFTPEQFKTVTHIDKAAWVEELKLHEELFKQLAYHLPAEMTATKAALAERLEA